MCDHIEIVTYLFLVCPLFGSLWYDIGRWLGIVAVYPHNFLDHLLQFVHIVGTSCTKRYILVMIWCACIWTIWKYRNRRIFSIKPTTTLPHIDSVKLLSFRWFKPLFSNFVFDYHNWWCAPLLSMS